MEVLLSYSLQDFLLFSAETWWILYQEFTASHFVMAAMTALFSIAFIVRCPNKYQTLQLVVLVVNVLLLITVVVYYLDFYIHINHFAVYLAIACLLQLSILILCYWQRSRRYWENTTKGVFLRLEPNAMVWLFAIGFIGFVVSPIFIQSEFAISAWGLLLPGWSPITSGVLLIFFARFYQKLPLLLLLPSMIVVIVEILTLYTMEMEFWWLALFALIAAIVSRRD